MENHISTQDKIQAVKQYSHQMILDLFKITIDPADSPWMDLVKEPDSIEKYIFSNQRIPKLADDELQVLGPKEENPAYSV